MIPRRSRSSTDGRATHRRRRILAAAATALALACLGGCRDAGNPAARSWFDTLRPGDPVEGKATARKLRLAGTTRNALLAEGGGRSLSLRTSDATWLDLSTATFCPGNPCAGSARFAVRATPANGPAREVYSITIDAADAARWHEARIDLDGLEKPLDLELTAETTGDGEHPPPVAVWAEPRLRRASGTGETNVILISIDTLRADRLGSYGHHRDTSPELDRLAARGARFAQVVSQAPWTTPSHMSMLTSLYPSSHGVNDSWRFVMDSGTHGQRRLGDDTETLAGILRGRGFATAAIADGAPTLNAEIGFDRGFDSFREVTLTGFEDYWENIVAQLDRFADDRFFLFLHTFEVHAPYRHPRYAEPLMTEAQYAALAELSASGLRDRGAIRRLRKHLIAAGLMKKEITSALYDGGIRFVDEFLIGALMAELERRGLSESTIVVVTSDHGDEFGEHDRRRIYDAHCHNLWDTLLLVPLIVYAPGLVSDGVEVTDQVRLIDVAPTILDLVGAEIPDAMQGRSLVPLLRGAADLPPVPAISEATCKGPEWKSMRHDGEKLIAAATADEGAWWEVDLGEAVEIDEVRVWARDDRCCSPLEYYWLLVSDRPNPLPSKSGVFRYFQTTAADRPAVIPIGTTGRYVRILQFGDGAVAIAEVEVMGRDGENAALGRTATQSGTHVGAFAERAVDGDRNGRFAAGSVSHTRRVELPDTADRVGMDGDFGVAMLFDVAADPGEQTDLSRRRPQRADQMRAELRERLSELGARAEQESERQPVDPALLERLRALGYAE